MTREIGQFAMVPTLGQYPDKPECWRIGKILWADERHILIEDIATSPLRSREVYDRHRVIAIGRADKLKAMKKKALSIAENYDAKMHEAHYGVGAVAKARRIELEKLTGQKL